VFRSRRREVVFPQREHARFAAAVADAWSDAFAPVRLPRERFVRGVAEHDRGYVEHDADEIGNLPPGRWLEVQERGFAPTREDSVVDLVVALHVRRLVSSGRDEESRRTRRAMDAELPALVQAAGVSADDAAAADRITDLCDRISFDFCLEVPATGSVEVLGADGATTEVRYALDGHGAVTLEPWPLAVARLAGAVQGYAAARYPNELEPVPTPFVVQPERGGA
jgi:Protein of unknown function (DUF3891)